MNRQSSIVNRHWTRRFALAALAVAALTASAPEAQHQLQPVAALRGVPAVELALRKLDTVGTFMMTTAHPDDENTRVIAYLANERLAATAYLSMTRGDGGQNLVGPELRDLLGLIRTQELLAARKIDGAPAASIRSSCRMSS